MPEDFQIEKPYDFVDFPSVSVQREEPAGHEQTAPDRVSGWFEAELFTLRPVQVASGITDFIRTQSGERLALSNVVGQKTVPALPGSSLKGAIRSLLEAICASCVPLANPRVRPYMPRRLGRCTDPQRLCPACRLFGAQDYQGQVAFEDATAPGASLQLIGTPLLWTPARSRGRGLPPRYLKGNEARGRKFYRHGQLAQGPDPRVVIKEGITINTRISFDNLTEAELGLLVSALGNHPQHQFLIKVGAGKPVGMGSVEIRLKAAVLLKGKAAIKAAGRLGSGSERLEGTNLKDRLKQWTLAAEQGKQPLLLKDQLEKLAGILRREELTNPSPSGAY